MRAAAQRLTDMWGQVLVRLSNLMQPWFSVMFGPQRPRGKRCRAQRAGLYLYTNRKFICPFAFYRGDSPLRRGGGIFSKSVRSSVPGVCRGAICFCLGAGGNRDKLARGLRHRCVVGDIVDAHSPAALVESMIVPSFDRIGPGSRLGSAGRWPMIKTVSGAGGGQGGFPAMHVQQQCGTWTPWQRVVTRACIRL